MSQSLINSRQLTAKLLIESDLMDDVKKFGELFGNNGKLPSVAVITKTESAYFGEMPVRFDKIKPATGY